MTNEIKYLALEGGGGKGAGYLGALLALEEFGLLPIQVGEKKTENKIKGIAGSSAGSITALLLAIGFTADELWDLTKSGEFSKFVFDPTRPYPTFANKSRMYSNSEYLGDKRIFDSTWWRAHDIYDFEDHLREYWLSVFIDLNSDPTILDRIIVLLVLTFLKNKSKKELQLVEPILKRLFQNKGEGIDDFLHNILIDKGLISGIEARTVLTNILNKKLPDYDLSSYRRCANTPQPITSYNQINNLSPYGNYIEIPPTTLSWQDLISAKTGFEKINELTFERLYEINEVDLIVTGTNLSKATPVYFSRHHTPDLPVIEAVGISMSIPLFFKPVFLDYGVRFEDTKDGVNQSFIDTSQYRGWFCDGGVINNFPLHAFNGYSEGKNSFDIAQITPEKSRMLELNPNVLGLILDSNKPKFISELGQLSELDTGGNRNFFNTIGLLGSLLDSLMYWSTEGGVPSDKLDQILRINAGTLDTYDFKPRGLDIAYTAPESYTNMIGLLNAVTSLGNRDKTKGMTIYNELVQELGDDPIYSLGCSNNYFEEWLSKAN